RRSSCRETSRLRGARGLAAARRSVSEPLPEPLDQHLLVMGPLGVAFPALHPVRGALEAEKLVRRTGVAKPVAHRDALLPELFARAVDQQQRRHVLRHVVDRRVAADEVAARVVERAKAEELVEARAGPGLAEDRHEVVDAVERDDGAEALVLG